MTYSVKYGRETIAAELPTLSAAYNTIRHYVFDKGFQPNDRNCKPWTIKNETRNIYSNIPSGIFK